MLLFDFCVSCIRVILHVSYGMECSPGGSMLSMESSKEESLVLFYFVFTLMGLLLAVCTARLCMFTGILAYADDIALLAPTTFGHA